MAFWALVDRTGGPDACWPWLGKKNVHGYGRLTWQGRRRQAAQVAYELGVGPIPEGKEPDHLCRNRGCANPRHLEAVTHRVNLLRSDAVSGVNARKTECVRGHELAGDNVRLARGKRCCRACARIYTAESRLRRLGRAA